MTDSKSSTQSTDEQEAILRSAQQDRIDETGATLADHSPEVEHILEKLDPKEQELISTMISYSGPLPPPDYLRGYAEVLPDAPERIFGWVDEQQNHRHSMEQEHLRNAFKLHNNGMTYGFIITLVFMIMGFSLILLDKEFLGLSMMAPFIVALATLLVTRTRNKDQKNESSIDKNDSEEIEPDES